MFHSTNIGIFSEWQQSCSMHQRALSETSETEPYGHVTVL
jgi:hypothetical protein